MCSDCGTILLCSIVFVAVHTKARCDYSSRFSTCENGEILRCIRENCNTPPMPPLQGVFVSEHATYLIGANAGESWFLKFKLAIMCTLDRIAWSRSVSTWQSWWVHSAGLCTEHRQLCQHWRWCCCGIQSHPILCIDTMAEQSPRCVLKDCSQIAPGAIVPPDTMVPSFTYWSGVPARLTRELPDSTEARMIDFTERLYKTFKLV